MRRRDERGLMLGTGLLALAVQAPIFDRWLSLLDEGYLLAIADAINRGKLLYRDVYVDAPFPGAFYLLAAWFRLFGTSVWTSRLLVVAAFTLLAVLTVRIGRELVSRRAALALIVLVLCYRIWAFPHWHIVSYSSTSATFLAAAVALIFHYLRRPSRLALLASGVLVGAGMLCKQDYGVGLGASLGLFLLLQPLLARRLGAPSPGALVPAGLFTAGAAAVVVPALGLFAAAGALGALIDQTFFRPLSIVTGFTYTRLPPITPLLHQDATLRAEMGSYLPAILLTLHWDTIAAGWVYRETAVWDVTLKLLFYAPILLWTIAALVWRPGLRDEPYDLAARRLLLLAWAGGFLLAFNRPRDWVHLMMVYPPALVLATVLGAQVLAPLPAVLRGASVVPALAVLAAISTGLAFDLRNQFSWPLRAGRAGIYADARHGPVIEDVLHYVDEHAPPATPVPVYPLQPMLGFLAGRETADGFFVIWPGQAPERDRRIIADLEARDVRVIIYSVSQYASLGSFRDNAPVLYDYLAHHYRIDAVFARETFGPLLTALVRRTGRDAGQSLLDRAADARPAGALTPALWPFAPVLAERVGTPAAPAVARIAIEIPPGGSTLGFAYGINPGRWLDVPSGPFTFALDVEEGGAPPAPVFRATVDPYNVLADRRWIDASVDLRAYAGRSVTLAFSISAPGEPVGPGDLAGWAEPRLVAP